MKYRTIAVPLDLSKESPAVKSLDDLRQSADRVGATAKFSGYCTVVADPPWPLDMHHGGKGGRHRNETPQPYDVMSVECIEQLPVSALAAADAHLYLWIPAKFNREGIGVRVVRAWGFEPVSEIIWAKPNFSFGAFPRLGHEVLLIGRRGDLPFGGRCNVHSVQTWKQTYVTGKRHSAKPEAAIDLIESVSPGPYVELFARRHRLGWDVWGNESANTAEMPA